MDEGDPLSQKKPLVSPDRLERLVAATQTLYGVILTAKQAADVLDYEPFLAQDIEAYDLDVVSQDMFGHTMVRALGLVDHWWPRPEDLAEFLTRFRPVALAAGWKLTPE